MASSAGDILREKYRIDAAIGRGGMGQVFAATELGARAPVAIEVVSRALVDDVLMVRLHREAEAAQRIRSDYVPRVLEVSETDEGETFLVMERLVGEPLSQRIRDNGALPWSEVRHIGEDILRGLIDAHTAGIIHRDLKPSNVFLARKESGVRAMVLDFGVCKVDGLDAERLTATGESIGTVAYMAPEQIRGAARVDERADLYAFGALVFEMLSGRLPHDGPSQMAILASKLERTPPSLDDSSRVAIPAGTGELIARALQREPERRPANAQELLKAWRALSKRDCSELVSGTMRSLAPEEGLTGADPPTEISRGPSSATDLGAEGAGEPASDATGEGVPRHRSVPSYRHPTQTSSLTTHAGSVRKGGSARVAVVLAAVGLIAGLGVASVSLLVRRPTAASPSVVSSSTEAPTVALEIASAAASGRGVIEPPPDDVEGDAFELPADAPAPASSTSIRPPKGHRTHPAPKSSTPGAPRITTQPRY